MYKKNIKNRERWVEMMYKQSEAAINLNLLNLSFFFFFLSRIMNELISAH